uniref:Uncharacterized protein n=1 Tax=Rhizophora mucronata TaxID=61149 RepID=A0A2P2NF43_RHIMU
MIMIFQRIDCVINLTVVKTHISSNKIGKDQAS